MAKANRQTILSQYIANILGNGRLQSNPARKGPISLASRSLAYGSMALLAVAPAQVGAVGLGEIHLKSQLGQPLHATVPVTLRDGEKLPKNCVQPAPRDGLTLNPPPNLSISSPAITGPGTYNVSITTPNALYEPMYELSLMIKCPGNPILVRQYIVMLDLPGVPVAVNSPQIATDPRMPITRTVQTAVAKNTPLQSSSVPQFAPQRNSRPATDPTRSLQRSTNPISADSQYRVVTGDTLSTIARRIDGRQPNSTWVVANKIFAENPQAFIRNNPDMIKLGALIRVPTLSELSELGSDDQPIASPQSEPAATRPQPVPVRENELPTADRTFAPPVSTVPVQTTEIVDVIEPPASTPVAPVDTQTDSTDTSTAVAEFSPFADEMFAPNGTNSEATANNPVVANAANEINNLQPAVSAPAIAASASEVSASSATESGEASSLLAILIGLLLGGFISLLLFRRQILEAFSGLRRKAAGRVSAPAIDDASVNPATSADRLVAIRSEPLQIGDPMEDTYIVETGAAETGTRESTVGLNSDHSDHSDHSDELAQLFDNDYSPDRIEASAAAAGSIEQPLEKTAFIKPRVSLPDSPTRAFETTQEPRYAEPDNEIFDPSGGLQEHAAADIFDPSSQLSADELDDDNFEPTAEMPRFADVSFEPTAEMPRHVRSGRNITADLNETSELPVDAMDDVFAATGEFEGPAVGDLESTLMQAFTDDLASVDADVMFATAAQNIYEPESGAQPETDASAELDEELPELADGLDEDDDLSETLHQALALLENDFDEEFTASQIIEQSQLKAALKGPLKESSDQNSVTRKSRKIS